MIDRYVKQQARDTITQNAHRDKANVRYARVPSATKTYDKGCPFCQMLASRGFVYYNEKTAGGKTRMKVFGAYHDLCNCQPVPAFFTQKADGYGRRIAPNVSIPGYDPDALYDEYLEHLQRFKQYRSESSMSGGSGWNGGGKKKKVTTDFLRFKDEMVEYAKGAKTVEELRERCHVIDGKFKANGYSDNEWFILNSPIQEIKRQLLAA